MSLLLLLLSEYEHGLEGITANHKAGPIDLAAKWLKIKCSQSESFVVIGYEPSTKMTGAIASLLLAERKGDGLVYVGNVGTGFKDQVARDLRKQLDGIKVAKPVALVKGKGLVFTKPDLVAEIEFRAWTNDCNLKHASFKGLRDAADNGEPYEI